MNVIIVTVLAAASLPEGSTALAAREETRSARLARLAEAAESQDQGEALSMLSRGERRKRLFE
jgi:hypothetical protein